MREVLLPALPIFTSSMGAASESGQAIGSTEASIAGEKLLF
jgi:hypothetical protein